MSEATRQRLDVWLWRARLFKTRSEAARSIAAGGVRLERAGIVAVARKPATPIAPGDGLTLAAGGGVRLLRVMALAARRGPPAEARALYADLLAPLGEPAETLDDAPPRTSSEANL